MQMRVYSPICAPGGGKELSIFAAGLAILFAAFVAILMGLGGIAWKELNEAGGG